MRAAAFLLAAFAMLAACGSPDIDRPDVAETSASTPTPQAGTTADASESDAESDSLVVIFFGDSLTAGLGLQNAGRDAYPALIAARFKAAGLPVRVINAGNSGETSAGGLNRVDWIVKRNKPDVFVLALGANDGLRGVDPDVTAENLGKTLDKVAASAPDAKLVVAGMEAMPNMGDAYTQRFRAIFPAVASAHGATLLPFLLDGIAGVPALNQSDGVHPTSEGHRRMADLVAPVVEPLIRVDA